MGTAAAFEGTGYARVVITATDSTQYAWENDHVIGEADKSIFTHYLVEGLKTGAADVNVDGWITLDEFVRLRARSGGDADAEADTGEVDLQTAGHFRHRPESVSGDEARRLPAELQTAIRSHSIWMREGAVRELDRMLNGNDPGAGLRGVRDVNDARQ